MKQAIIIGNGKKPYKKALNYLLDKGIDTIVGADGGANNLYKMRYTPNYIIGDFDSIKSEVYDYYKDKCKFIKYDRQDDTDIEKSIKFLVENDYEKIYLLAVTGKRLDHTFANLSHLIKYYNQVKIVIIDKKNFICPYSGTFGIKTRPNETISIFGVDTETKITAKELKYPLDNFNLPFGKRVGSSNEATMDYINFQINNGVILIFRNTQMAIENDFLFYA